MKHFITEEHVRNMLSSQRECWICKYFIENIKQQGKKYYIPDEILYDDGIVEHLKQLIQK